MLAVNEGALEGEIDEADGDAVFPDRDLSEQQRGARGALQHFQRFAHAPRGAVDLVDEQEARDVRLLELAQHDLEGRDLALVGFAHDHRRVANRRHAAHLVQEFHRTGAIDEGHRFAEECRGGDVRLDAHAVAARLRLPVADRIAVGYAAGALDGAGPLKYRFEKGCLAALEGADDGDAPGPHG
jgi:hypothetical protein